MSCGTNGAALAHNGPAASGRMLSTLRRRRPGSADGAGMCAVLPRRSCGMLRSTVLIPLNTVPSCASSGAGTSCSCTDSVRVGGAEMVGTSARATCHQSTATGPLCWSAKMVGLVPRWLSCCWALRKRPGSWVPAASASASAVRTRKRSVAAGHSRTNQSWAALLLAANDVADGPSRCLRRASRQSRGTQSVPCLSRGGPSLNSSAMLWVYCTMQVSKATSRIRKKTAFRCTAFTFFSS